MKVILTPDSPSISFSDFCKRLEEHVPKNPKVRAAFLAGACALSTTIDDEGLLTKDGSSIFALSALIAAAKTLVDGYWPLWDPADPMISESSEFARDALKAAEGIQADAFFKSNDRSTQIMDVVAVLCSNGIYQTQTKFQFVNVLVLTGLKGFGKLGSAPELIEDLFQKKASISARDYFFILFSLWAMARKTHTLHTDHAMKSSTRAHELTVALERVLDDLALETRTPLSDSKLSFLSKVTGKSKGEALLIRKPILRSSSKHLHLSGHQFIKVQLTSKFLTKAKWFASELHGSWSNPFSICVAERFEIFFGELLDARPPIGELTKEFEYEAGHNAKTPDWMILEPHGSSEAVTLFQLKLKGLTDGTHYGASIDDLKRDLQSSFAEAISKSIIFLHQATNALNNGRVREDRKQLVSRLCSGSLVNLIGVVPDLPGIFAFRPVREMLMDEVRSKVSEEVWNWFDGRYRRRWKWHIFDLAEFQAFLSMPADRRSFHQCIRRYWQEVNSLPRKGEVTSDFRSFLLRTYFGRSRDRNVRWEIPEIAKLFSDTFNEMIAYLDLSTKGDAAVSSLLEPN